MGYNKNQPHRFHFSLCTCRYSSDPRSSVRLNDRRERRPRTIRRRRESVALFSSERYLHTKGKSETLTCEDCRYKLHFHKQKGSKVFWWKRLNWKKLAQMKTALLNLTQTCCSVVPFEFWVTLSCSFSDVFSKKSFIQKGEFVTSNQNVQNNEFSVLFCWTLSSVCYRAGLILAVWRRPRRWSNSRAALIAPSVWAGLWQLIRPAHQQQPGRPSISSPTEADSGRRKQLNSGRKVNSQWTMKCWNAKVISFIWRGCKFHIRLWRLTHTREQFLSRRFLSLNSRIVFRPTTCVWSESITNGGESCLMLQKNLLLITSGGLWTGPILHNEHFDASILHWEQRTTSPAALLE